MAAAVDVVVVGGGPAGLSAATWLGRYRRSVVVLDDATHRNDAVAVSHGYLGFDPVAPAELLARARRDLARYATVTIMPGRADRARVDHDGTFLFDLGDGGTLRGSRVVLATGVRDVFPDVPDFFQYYGTSIFHCPSCDGYEALDKPVVVFGWSSDVAGFALGLLEWAASVTVVTDGRRFAGDQRHRDALMRRGIRVVEDQVVALSGSDRQLTEVRLRQGGAVTCALAFFSIEHRPRTALAAQLGCQLTSEGCVVVDVEGRTSVAGVYAAGDITPGMQYVVTAAADGARAGTACALALRDAALGGNDGWHDRPDEVLRRQPPSCGSDGRPQG